MARVPSDIAFFSDARAWGGAEVYLMQLLSSVRDAGLSPRVFCADRPEAAEWVSELRRLGYAVELFRPTKEFNPLGYFLARRLLRGFELVHFNKTHPRNCLPAVVAARHCGASAVVATEHIALPPVSHYPFGRVIITALIRFTNRYLDRTIAVSDQTREMLIENYGVPPGRVVAIRNGVDVAAFGGSVDGAAVRRELGLSRDDRVAVMIGRVAPRKGHDLALRAVARARDRLPALRMVFVGEGELLEEIEQESARLGVDDRVVFAGFRRDVPEVLAAADAFVLSSEGESLPLTILEAMSAGLPVISTDVGGISEAVESGTTGLLVESGDADGLADAMVAVLGDPEMAASMGSRGRRKVEEEFSLEACSGSVFRLYEEILSEKGLP